jgi:hypothetical protein
MMAVRYAMKQGAECQAEKCGMGFILFASCSRWGFRKTFSQNMCFVLAPHTAFVEYAVYAKIGGRIIPSSAALFVS